MPEPKKKEGPETVLRLICAGAIDVMPPGSCQASLEVPFWLIPDEDAMAMVMDEMDWFMSLVTPPGQGKDVPIVMCLLCPDCANKLHHPGVMKRMREIRAERMAKRKGEPGKVS